MQISHRISADSKICHGKPCIEGTRIPVYIILELLAEDTSSNEILREYPHLTKEDIKAAINYGAKLATEEISVFEPEPTKTK